MALKFNKLNIFAIGEHAISLTDKTVKIFKNNIQIKDIEPNVMKLDFERSKYRDKKDVVTFTRDAAFDNDDFHYQVNEVSKFFSVDYEKGTLNLFISDVSGKSGNVISNYIFSKMIEFRKKTLFNQTNVFIPIWNINYKSESKKILIGKFFVKYIFKQNFLNYGFDAVLHFDLIDSNNEEKLCAKEQIFIKVLQSLIVTASEYKIKQLITKLKKYKEIISGFSNTHISKNNADKNSIGKISLINNEFLIEAFVSTVNFKKYNADINKSLFILKPKKIPHIQLANEFKLDNQTLKYTNSDVIETNSIYLDEINALILVENRDYYPVFLDNRNDEGLLPKRTSVFAIIKNGNKYLFQYNQHWKNYSLIGGKKEVEEKPEQALIRKLNEELIVNDKQNITPKFNFKVKEVNIKNPHYNFSQRTLDIVEYHYYIYEVNVEKNEKEFYQYITYNKFNKWLSSDDIISGKCDYRKTKMNINNYVFKLYPGCNRSQ